MLTKKHYKAIAQIIKNQYTLITDVNIASQIKRETLHNITKDLCDYFHSDNNKFSHDKFNEYIFSKEDQ
jgi:hypothetical protein